MGMAARSAPRCARFRPLNRPVSPMRLDAAYARELDRNDALAPFRARFAIGG